MDRLYFWPLRGDSRASRHGKYKKLLQTLRDTGTLTFEDEISTGKSTCSTYSSNTCLLEKPTTSTKTEFQEMEQNEVKFLRDIQDSSDNESEKDKSVFFIKFMLFFSSTFTHSTNLADCFRHC